nr:type II secretion system F family protein [Allochromatium palmeri]
MTSEEHLVRVLTDLQERVRGGATFSSALEAQDRQFPRLYINMVRAGEASGARTGAGSGGTGTDRQRSRLSRNCTPQSATARSRSGGVDCAVEII